MTAPPVVLAVAGTDSGGAAGLAADLATIGHLGCHAACVVTAVTAQDTTAVHAIHPMPLEIVAAQLDAVLTDLPVAVVKTGMLGSPETVRLVAARLAHLPIVVDPVLVATSGAVLGDGEVVDAYLSDLLTVAALATPNLDEARALTGRDGPPAELAARLADLGCAVVVTGGSPFGDGSCTDWLCLPGGRAEPLPHRAVATTADHGSGCTFSSAAAALLAPSYGRNAAVDRGFTRDRPTGTTLLSVSREAADYVSTQLTTSSTWDLGRGRGPIAHTSTAHTTLGGTP